MGETYVTFMMNFENVSMNIAVTDDRRDRR